MEKLDATQKVVNHKLEEAGIQKHPKVIPNASWMHLYWIFLSTQAITKKTDFCEWTAQYKFVLITEDTV